MRILVTNDDGIHSPGLVVAEQIARAVSDDVWVVAPENEQSGASHSLTLASPLRLRRMDDRHYAVSGTPTDCAAPQQQRPAPFGGAGLVKWQAPGRLPPGLLAEDQYSQKMRCNSLLSLVLVSATMARMRAF